MKIEKITINNFKSFGDKNNYVTMGDDVIALVGKNESGKSNFIAALDSIQLFDENIPPSVFKHLHRQRESESVSIDIRADVYPGEFSNVNGLKDYASNDKEPLHFSFHNINEKHSAMSFDGIFKRAIEADTTYMQYAIEFMNAMELDKRKLSGDDLLSFEAYKKWACNPSSICMKIDWNWMRSNYNKIDAEHVAYLTKYYSSMFSLFRENVIKIFTYKESLLNNTYNIDELRQNDKQNHLKSNDILNKLILVIGQNPKDFEKYITEPDPGKKATIQEAFRHGLETFSKDFNAFYNNEKEHVSLNLMADSRLFSFTVKTSGKNGSFTFSERSNGLKWYLCFFIALRAAHYKNNVLILIDEPAVHLHVDAQKEVLALFDNLAQNGNQVIYTTHCPSMLDINRIGRIRVLQKENETTHIKTVYESAKGINNQETLSPIVHAMGCSLRYELSPSADKMNLIVEGITDYYYFQAFMHIFRPIDGYKKFYVIPACSADKVHGLLSIFLGWGYDYKVMLDHDNQGKNVHRGLAKSLGEAIGDKVMFVSDDDGSTVESLLSEELRVKYQSTSKLISAKKFMDDVISGILKPDELTTDNFRRIFRKLGVIDTTTTQS